MELQDRVALVTAAAGAGIGKASALALARAGADVVVTDRHEGRTASVAEEIAGLTGRRVVGMPLDVTKEDQVADVLAEAVRVLGRLDIVVDNSGYNDLSPISEMSTESWNQVLQISLTSHFWVLRTALRLMLQQQEGGSIVEIASTAAWKATTEGSAHYAAAKAGVLALARCAAVEVAQHGIRVNAVAPGLIFNDFLLRIYPPEFFERAKSETPLQRMGLPEDVANAVVFLAGEHSRHMTGTVLNVSGGQYFNV